MLRSILVALFLLIPGTGPFGQEPEPRWQWSSEQANAVVNQVRAGRDLSPAQWPGGARVAVLLSFDVDVETLAIMYGGPTVTELSQGEFGARRGMQRVLEVLDRHQLPATFFFPAVSLTLHPELAAAVNASGRHEIGVHGWIHEDPSTLTAEEERTLLVRAVDTIERISGRRPTGYRAPSWVVTPHTIALVQDLGFLYDSSLMADDRPYELIRQEKPTGLVELPVNWILDDYPYFSLDEATHVSPSAALEVFTAEFDWAREENSFFLLTMHPQIIGHRSRIQVLERLIEHIQSQPGAWFATHTEAARYVLDHAPANSTDP